MWRIFFYRQYCQHYHQNIAPLKEFKAATTAAGLHLHNQALAAWRWKGYKVVLTDGATVQMPDTPENQADFPQLDSQKAGLGFPIARMVVLISLATDTKHLTW